MARIDIPDGADPIVHVFGSLGSPTLMDARVALGQACYRSETTLSAREREVARYRSALLTDCAFCMQTRMARDLPGFAGEEAIPEELYDHVGGDRGWDGFSERERLAIEFTERFALDHLGMDDDALWARLRAAFTDSEIVDLCVLVGAWMGTGRMNRVLGIHDACELPPDPTGSISRIPAVAQARAGGSGAPR